MAVRTTAALIRTIIDVDPSLVNLTPFITMANLQVNTCCTGYNAVDDAELLELIERNLSAHYLCMRDPRTASESVTGVSSSYLNPSIGKYLEATIYGQAAIGLDNKGGLARLQAKMMKGGIPFSVGWVGTPTQSEMQQIGEDNSA